MTAKKTTSKKTTSKKAVKSGGKRSRTIRSDHTDEDDVEILKRLKETQKFIENEQKNCYEELLKLGRPRLTEFKSLKERRRYLNRKYIVLGEQGVLLDHIILDIDDFDYDSRHHYMGHDPFRHIDGYMFENDY